MSRGTARGTVLVEVLVAVGILALVLGSLVTLHAASLRATRSAAATRELAAAAEAEATLRSIVASPGPACLVATRWPGVSNCQVRGACGDDACSSLLQEITVTTAEGGSLSVVAAGAGLGAANEAPP